jgi:hypothetical protein
LTGRARANIEVFNYASERIGIMENYSCIVELTFDRKLATAEEGQRLAIKIEQALEAALEDTEHAPSRIVCRSPLEGVVRNVTFEKG